MRTVDERLQELYLRTDRCVRCGRCSAVCPTYKVTLKESMLARGRIKLVREYVEANLQLSKRFKLYNNLCLGCGACLDACPARIETPELIRLMKIEMIKQYGMPVIDSLLLKRVLASPQSFRNIIKLFSINRKLGITKLLPGMIKATEQIIPEIPKKSFRDLYFTHRKREMKNLPGKYKVGYFVGCLTNALFPSLVFDIIKVLENHDCEVIIPEEYDCCGLPHQSYGDIARSRKIATINIEAFLQKQVDYIVTDCGTCSHALKDYKNYDWIHDEEKLKAKAFSSRVFDINEFLVDIVGLKVGPKPIKECSVTYHDSCHLNRSQKIFSQPRKILMSIPGVLYKEMPEANWCCGAAGSYSFQHHDISQKILQRKMDNVKSTGAQYVTAGCPACLMQLDYGKRAFSLNSVEVLHPVQILARTF